MSSLGMEESGLIYRLYRTRFISELTYSQFFFIKRELKDCHDVLDIGCGWDSPLKFCKVPYSIGVDIFEPAIKASKQKLIHDSYIISDVINLEFRPDSFDAVILCEVLEHLDKDNGNRLLDKVESWARKKILVSTPNGYLAQAAQQGNPYQVHRSGWQIEEIRSRGYKTYGMVGLRWKPSRFLFFPLAFWALISAILQGITYHFPKIAFEVFYVKDKTADGKTPR